MTNVRYTEHTELNFRNVRTDFYYQQAGELITPEEIIQVLEDIRDKGQLEPAFAKMDIVHQVPFFLKRGERYPVQLVLKCQVFFGDKKPTLKTMERYIRSYPQYAGYKINLWDILFRALPKDRLRKCVPYVSSIVGDELLISCDSPKPIVINSKTLEQEYPKSKARHDEGGIPAIKPIVDPVEVMRTMTRERDKYMFNNGYVAVKEY